MREREEGASSGTMLSHLVFLRITMLSKFAQLISRNMDFLRS